MIHPGSSNKTFPGVFLFYKDKRLHALLFDTKIRVAFWLALCLKQLLSVFCK